MINGKKIIALCTYRVYDSQVFSFVSELNRLLRANKCCLFIYAINTEIGNGGENMAEVAVFDLIPYDKVDCVIVMDEKIKSREVTQSIIDKANLNKIPAIVIDGIYENVSMVNFDYAKGFETVVRHIIEYHHVRNPHLMAGKRRNPYSKERIEVFKKVIAENGIQYDDSMLSYGNFWSIPSRAAAKKLLKRSVMPDAVICANDIMAINVCDVFQSAGVKVPDDVLVSGFDGIDEAFWANPGLTTAICDSTDLAKEIDDVIRKLFKGSGNITRWITPKFIENSSCGCPRQGQDLLSVVNGLNNRFYHHQDDLHIMQYLTSKIMCGQSLEEGINYLRNALTEYMCCVVEDAVFDLERNFLLEDVEKGSMSIIYDSYRDEDVVKPYDPDTIVPNLDEIMRKGYPLVFNALEYLGKSPGFVCYSYPRLDIIDYSKAPSITNSLGMGIGGYISMKYQYYLRNKLQKMYESDALTGLYNRLAFLSEFEDLKDDPSNQGELVTIIMCDVNGLKQINDSLGHGAGDKAIAAVANALKASCPEKTLCVRLGGDEMLALILGDCDSRSIISSIMDRLDEDSYNLGYTVSASLGSYSTTFTSDIDLDKVIGVADEKMYVMKREYKKDHPT